MLALAVSAVGTGAVLAVNTVGGKPPDPRPVARSFAQAWADGDLDAMYRELTPRARRENPRTSFDDAYARSAATASLRRVRVAGPVHVRAGTATVPMVAVSKLFGDVPGTLTVPLTEVDGQYLVAWKPLMTFPGLTDGETLERVYKVPKSRGAILSQDSEPLAIGPRDARRYPAGTPFALITGFVRTPESAADLAQRRTLGWSDEEYGQAGPGAVARPDAVGAARCAAGRPLGRRPRPQAGGPCRQAPAQREDDAVRARPGGGGDGAGRSQRWHRRARRAERRAARGGRERADRPAAARLDVQDGDGIGGA